MDADNRAIKMATFNYYPEKRNYQNESIEDRITNFLADKELVSFLSNSTSYNTTNPIRTVSLIVYTILYKEK